MSVAIWAGMAWAIHLERQNPSLATAIVLLCLILLITTSLAILNKRLLSSHQFRDWYKPSWPGWQPISIVIAVFSIYIVVNIAIEDISFQPLPVEITYQFFVYIFDTFVTALLLSFLVYKTKWREIGYALRMRTNIRFCVAWILMNLRIFYIAIWVAPPFLLAALVNIFAVPPYDDVLKTTGGKFDPLANTLIYLSNGFVNYWPIMAIPLIVLMLMIFGRYLLLYDQLPLKVPPPSVAHQ